MVYGTESYEWDTVWSALGLASLIGVCTFLKFSLTVMGLPRPTSDDMGRSQIKSAIIGAYRLIQLDNALAQWSNPQAKALFDGMVALRIAGYGSRHSTGVVPLDTTSWFATHYLVCPLDTFVPVMGFHRVTARLCQRHHTDFPALAHCLHSGSSRHAQAVRSLMGRYEDRPDDLSYIGGFTIDPALKAPGLRKELSELLIAIQHFFHSEADGQHQIICFAVVPFKIDVLHQQYGYVPLIQPRAPEDDTTIALHSFGGLKARLMTVQTFNENVMPLEEQYRDWWNERTLFQACRDAVPA